MTAAQYVDRVDQLLSGVDEDDRRSVVADLVEQLGESDPESVMSRLGSPEEFVTQYLEGAGLTSAPGGEREGDRLYRWAKVLALPLGIGLLCLLWWWALSPSEEGGGAFPTVVLIGAALLVATLLGYLVYKSEQKPARPRDRSSLVGLVLFLIALYFGFPLVMILVGALTEGEWPIRLLAGLAVGLVILLLYRRSRE
jgi:hypothetical protein